MHDDDIEPPRSAGTVLPSWSPARRDESLDGPDGRTASSTADGSDGNGSGGAHPTSTDVAANGTATAALIDRPRAGDWARPASEDHDATATDAAAATVAVSPDPSATAPAPVAHPARRRPIWLIVPVMVLSTAAVIYVLGRTSGPRPARVPPTKPAPTTTAPNLPAPSTSTTVSVTVPASSTSASSTTTVVVTTTSALVASTSVAASTASTSTIKASSGESAAPGAAAPRSAVYRSGKLYLLGTVPSREVADAVIAKAAAVVGPGNVVDQYDIVPGTPSQSASPLRIADTVLFDPESDVVLPEFRQLLDLGVVLLKQNPAVTVVVTGHTDSQGGVSMNERLAQRRVDNVIAYFVSKGIDRARLTGVAKGQADPIADNATVAGRRLNRRIEFVIEHLLD